MDCAVSSSESPGPSDTTVMFCFMLLSSLLISVSGGNLRYRIIAAAVLAAVLCLALLAACGSGEPTRKDYEAIKGGTPRSEVLEKFGEPDSGLSGFFGDIYNCGDQVVVIYYEVDYGSDAATVSKVTITKRQSPNG